MSSCESLTSGVRASYASTILPGLILGPAVFFAYRAFTDYLKHSFDTATLLAFSIPVLYGLPAFFLIAVVLLQRRLWPGFELIGRFDAKLLGLGAAAVALTYLLEVAVVLHLGLGREFQMSMLGFGLTPAQYWLMIVSVLVLPPIVEELAYRTFLLQALPFNRHWAVAGAAILLSAGCFMWAHFGVYQLWTTHALMFALGVIFALGRVITGGVVYSMILHSVAVACALLLNYAGEVLGWSGW
ncbi:CPBP family intramembrane metalloprotease [Pseudomonas carnis]|jgi:hypothetical protein|uniref:CPBP family intramembrane glutamic endopeptidase n=1 Tax=Pseudomonas carnis TaxID=2487355 RepID=UPI0018E7CFF4|nr:CPBP family intramembrane glutamic endopeptidase [Pseudomonas carnis]MBJ2214052.1 CPBP family intramembrane metalloprotease [Pseudomonas carnis]